MKGHRVVRPGPSGDPGPGEEGSGLLHEKSRTRKKSEAMRRDENSERGLRREK